jgi:hypothetical protein
MPPVARTLALALAPALIDVMFSRVISHASSNARSPWAEL